jgi:hypothetical protein
MHLQAAAVALAATILASAFVVLTPPTMARAADDLSCRTFPIVGRQSLRIKRSKVEGRARYMWEWDVLFKAGLGAKFAHWGQARDRHTDCHKKLGTWRCRAVARPCRLV